MKDHIVYVLDSLSDLYLIPPIPSSGERRHGAVGVVPEFIMKEYQF
jgi:hypothetical protein